MIGYYEYDNLMNEKYPELWDYIDQCLHMYDYEDILKFFNPKFSEYTMDMYEMFGYFDTRVDMQNEYGYDLYRQIQFDFFQSNEDKHELWIAILQQKLL